MSDLTRRRFLRGSLAVAGGTLVASRSKVWAQALGANERIRIAVAGINSRGTGHIASLMGIENVEVACLVDPDSRLFDSRAKKVEDKTGKKPKCIQDVRQALADKDLDAISIATPNYWHSLMTIWACQAGKDVYVEKPMSHGVREGRVAVDAARKYNRIVQHGTQARSDPDWAHVVAAIKSGKLGKLLVARGLCYKNRPSIGFKPHAQPPKELDYNLWLGPVLDQPYHENLVHYNWHWFYPTGDGDIGNQGVHQMDIARWGIAGATLPKRVVSLGGRFGYVDQAETANTQMAVMDFGQTQLIFEVRGLPTDKYRGAGTGNIFHLEAGTIIDKQFYPKDSDQPAPLPDVKHGRGPGGEHFANFIAAMRSRKPADLNAEVLEGHYSSALCHLANISHRLGRRIAFKPRTEALGNNQAACETLERMEQHLANNGVDLEDSALVLGQELLVDPQTETITNDPQANAMLTRYYRKGFEVPASIA